jgi:hypothetical protein
MTILISYNINMLVHLWSVIIIIIIIIIIISSSSSSSSGGGGGGSSISSSISLSPVYFSSLVHKQATLSLKPFQFCASLLSKKQCWLLVDQYSWYSIFIYIYIFDIVMYKVQPIKLYVKPPPMNVWSVT